MWRVHKEAGRPFPQLSEDDFIDYCVTEAVMLKAAKEDEKRREEAERKDYKAGHKSDEFRKRVEAGETM